MPPARSAFRLFFGSLICLSVCGSARAQEPAAPPAYLAVVEGTATLERDGDVQPAVRDMPFVTGDRLRTEAGRVEIDFPDGTAIEVGSYSEVEALSPTRVRLLSGTMDHLQRRASATSSASYLPQDLQSYGQTFDQNGSWQNDPEYGNVWYPRVAADWRPYYYGSWSAVPTYGWTWVGLDAWSWPTHHYGRWGHARNAWFWIPGRTWSGAWVSWGLSADYVSWCPLGFDGRPVFALSVGLGGRGWSGWTVMSRSHFGSRGHYAHNDSVDPRRFDARTPFVQTARLPLTLPHDRDRSRGRGETRASVTESRERQAPRSIVVAPPASAGVADPRGSRSNERRTPNDYRRAPNDYRPTPNDYRPAPSDSRQWPNVEPRTPNRFERGVPTPAPRLHEPVVPPARVVPPTAPTKTTSEYRRPTPEYRRPTPEYRPPTQGYRPPTYDSRPPANDSREHARAPERAAPAARSAPADRSRGEASHAVPRGTAAAPGKADGGAAKRPR